jgi:hypothetical protein
LAALAFWLITFVPAQSGELTIKAGKPYRFIPGGKPEPFVGACGNSHKLCF